MREVIYLVLNSRNKKNGLTPCFSVPANLCVKVLMSSEKPSFMELWPSRRPSHGNRQVVYERISQRCVQREPATGTAGARDLAQEAKCPLESLSATLPTRDSSLPPVSITLRLIPLPWCTFCWFLLPAYLMSSR